MDKIVSERKSERVQFTEEMHPYDEASAKAKDLAFTQLIQTSEKKKSLRKSEIEDDFDKDAAALELTKEKLLSSTKKRVKGWEKGEFFDDSPLKHLKERNQKVLGGDEFPPDQKW